MQRAGIVPSQSPIEKHARVVAEKQVQLQRLVAEEHVPRVMPEEHVPQVVTEVINEEPSPSVMNEAASPPVMDEELSPPVVDERQINEDPWSMEKKKEREKLIRQMILRPSWHQVDQGLNEELSGDEELDEEQREEQMRDDRKAHEYYKRLLANPGMPRQPNEYGFGGMHCVGGPRNFWNDPMVYTQTLKLLGWAVLIVVVAVIYNNLW